MSLLRFKRIAEELPPPLGKIVANVPFEWRFGPAYSSSAKIVRNLKNAPPQMLKEWAFPQLRAIVEHFYQHSPFYQAMCQRHGFHPDSFKSFEHFQDAPIITKNDLREFELPQRSVFVPGRMLINTGGTSGQPLSFYIDRQAFAREWAHMHLIWGQAGYHFREAKLTMRGRNMGERLIKYNPIHNEWIVNTYANRTALFSELSTLLDKEKIRWIHGYPSIVAEIISEMAELDIGLVKKIKRNLKGVFLGSEFPAPQYVVPIRQILGCDITSWYGHSEMCVLAFEKGTNHYNPLHSYGLVEAVGEAGSNQRLLGTSYWNRASPFIRYDTGDMVHADVEQGVVQSFQITSGRIGDFVVDRDGTKIALTALIFGRHHAAFDRVKHVQVRQKKSGSIELLVVPQDSSVTSEFVMAGFAFTNVNMNVSPILLPEPIRTPAGKISLLVK